MRFALDLVVSLILFACVNDIGVTTVVDGLAWVVFILMLLRLRREER